MRGGVAHIVLSEGTYRAEVSSDGFSSVELVGGLNVKAGATTYAQLELSPSELETINVGAGDEATDDGTHRTQSSAAVAFDKKSNTAYVSSFNSSGLFTSGGPSTIGFTSGPIGGPFTDLQKVPTGDSNLFAVGTPSIWNADKPHDLLLGTTVCDASGACGYGVTISLNGGTYSNPMALVNTPTSLSYPHDGTFVAGEGKWAGHLYLFYNGLEGIDCHDPIHRVEGRGERWSSPSRIGPNGTLAVGAYPAVAPDGTIYVTWNQYSDFTSPFDTFISHSRDDGQTWSHPSQILSNVEPSGHLQSGCGDPGNPVQALTYLDSIGAFDQFRFVVDPNHPKILSGVMSQQGASDDSDVLSSMAHTMAGAAGRNRERSVMRRA
jgi:hypothetical protein